MAGQAARAITQAFRAQQTQLNAGVLHDLSLLWPLLDWHRLPETYPGYASATSTLITYNREKIATLAAGYLQAFRLASGIGDLVQVKLAPAAPAEQISTSLLVTGPVAFKTAIRSGATIEKAAQVALVTSSGSVSRLVLNAGRQTVLDTVRDDPRARGWERVTSGDPCPFCEMLAGRGAVYSENTVDFEAHDHCNCTVEPVFGS